MPDGNQLCHGDFWGGNILMSPRGEVIIDWNRACYGNPLADLARTTNAAVGYLWTHQARRAFLSSGQSRLSQKKFAFSDNHSDGLSVLSPPVLPASGRRRRGIPPLAADHCRRQTGGRNYGAGWHIDRTSRKVFVNFASSMEIPGKFVLQCDQ